MPCWNANEATHSASLVYKVQILFIETFPNSFQRREQAEDTRAVELVRSSTSAGSTWWSEGHSSSQGTECSAPTWHCGDLKAHWDRSSKSRNSMVFSIWFIFSCDHLGGGCFGLSCVSTKSHIESLTPLSKTVTVFGYQVFTELIMVKWGP